MIFLIFNFFLSTPHFRKFELDYQKRNQLISHLLKSDIHLKIFALITIISYSIMGGISLKIPILKDGVIALLSLTKMHTLMSYPVKDRFTNQIKTEDSSTIISFDEIIVGSGVGGSIAAMEAMVKGRRTLIVEMGSEIDPQIPHQSLGQLATHFLHGGQEIAFGNRLITYAQGSALGGGSEINSGLYHKLPKKIRHTWLKKLNINSKEWNKSEKYIEELLRIEQQKQVSLGCYRNSPFIFIAKANGWDHMLVPRWRHYANKKFVHFGMTRAVLEGEQQKGLHILKNHRVLKFAVNKENIVVTIKFNGGTKVLNSKYLTLAGGTTETPRLLVRSGFAKPKDLFFNFHAMTRLVAVFGRKVNDLKDIDPHQTWNRDRSVKFGAAVGTIEFLEATLSNFKVSEKISHENALVAYASTEPKGVGRFIKVGSILLPYFKFTKASLREISLNTKLLKSSLQEAGAIKIFGSDSLPNISSVHIFGSLPLGKTKLLDKNGFLKHTRNKVRVCDGSLLPSAPLVNPQGPLAVLSLVLSRRVNNRYWK